MPKDGIGPLEGVIETDWLPFTFTMNWQFTRPGRVVFEKGEPFCFITPIAYHSLEQVTPEIVPIAAAPEVAAEYEAYAKRGKTLIPGSLKTTRPQSSKGGKNGTCAEKIHSAALPIRNTSPS